MSMHLQPNTLLESGKYRILETLGQGGFGITYLAEHCITKRKVCIKEFFPKEYYKRDDESHKPTLLSATFESDMERFKAKFLKEAQTIAALAHPNIVQIFDAFEENDTAYYTMEYIDGESLSAHVKRCGALSEDAAINYILQIASALEHIHAHQFMHLDVKPGNIMLNKYDNRAVLIDFGLSKHYDERSGEATSTTPVGVSHGFAPMEQYRAGGVKSFSPETDIYSLGATLYYLITAETPPQATEVADEGLPAMPAHISQATKKCITQAMNFLRKDRPHSIAEFTALLQSNDDVVVRIEDEATSIVIENKPYLNSEETELVIGKSKERAKYYEADSHMYADLGLSVMWATCNIGALAPEDFGDTYAWGETMPNNNPDNNKCATYKKPISVISGKGDLDAARRVWGGWWRMPTKDEIEELIDRCTWRLTKVYDIIGYKVIGPNGNSIFLPIYNEEEDDTETNCCDLWSGTPDIEEDNTGAFGLHIDSNTQLISWYDRCSTLRIRPVRD